MPTSRGYLMHRGPSHVLQSCQNLIFVPAPSWYLVHNLKYFFDFAKATAKLIATHRVRREYVINIWVLGNK